MSEQTEINHSPFLRETRGPICSVFSIWCPACEETHGYTVYPNGDKGWRWNGNAANPTFTPSIRLFSRKRGEQEKTQCHLNLTDGMLIFHGDCPHSFAGKTVPMVELTTRN